MTYTDEELSQAVSKIVRTSVRFQYDSLGTRRTEVSFNDLQDAAAGVFISFDSSAYYLARLAANRLEELVEDAATFIDSFITTAQACGRKVTPVERLSSLAQARVALDALSGASSTRDGTFQQIQDVPAFKRFSNNADVFLRQEGKKVRSGGQIVKTPAEAQAELRGLAVDLRSQHTEILRRVGLLANAIDDYEGMNLPARMAGDIIANASDVLRGRVEELEALTPQARLGVMRDVVLDVLATRSIVRGFGSLDVPTLFVILSGEGGLFYDAFHPATPAALLSTEYEGYNFFPGQIFMALIVDDPTKTDATVTLQMPGSFVPNIDSTRVGPYTVPSPNEFDIRLPTFLDENVTLTSGTRETWQVVEEINASIGSQPVEAIVQFVTPKTTQECDVENPFTMDWRFKLPSVGTPTPPSWTDLGVDTNDLVVVRDESSAMDGVVFNITALLDADYTLQAVPIGSGTPVVETDTVVVVGPEDAQNIVIRVKNSSAEDALNGEWTMTLEDVEPGSLGSIGYYSPAAVTARQTRAKDIVSAINKSISASDVSGTPRIKAEEQFDALWHVGKAHTGTDPAKLYVYNGRGDAVITEITIPNVFQRDVKFELDSDGDWSDVELFDVIILRETEEPDDLNLTMSIVEVGSTYFIGRVAVSLEPALQTVLIETTPVSWSLSPPTQYTFMRIVIDEGTPLDGVYETERYDSSDPFVLKVRGALVPNLTFGGQPFFFDSLQWGLSRVKFQSFSDALDSYVKVVDEVEDFSTNPSTPDQPVADDASSELFTTVPVEQYGNTEWYELPEKTRKVEDGDTLEFHNTRPLVSDLVTVITEVEDRQVLRVTPEILLSQADLPFDRNSQVPFGRVRKTKKQNFTEMQEQLLVWDDLQVADPLYYFRRLDTALNPVVSNKNPTPGQIGTLVSVLGELKAALVEGDASLLSATSTYFTNVVEQVDALLNSYADKGADRAVDLLLEGSFSAFFGLTIAGSSYAGRLQETIKGVVMDMPLRKTKRQDLSTSAQEQLIGSYDDVDFDYTPDDIDPEDRVEITEFADVMPGVIPVP